MDKKLVLLLVVILAVGAGTTSYFFSNSQSEKLTFAQVGGGPPGGTPAQGGPSGWTDNGTAVRLTTDTDKVGIGTSDPIEKLDIVGNISLNGLIDGIDLSVKALDWDTAFAERRRWDGGAQSLDPALGRTSLSLGALSTLNTVSGGVGGTVTDKTISEADLSALNHVILKDTDGSNCHKVTVNSSGVLNTTSVDCISGEPPSLSVSENFDSYTTGSLLDESNGGFGWTTTWVKIAAGDFIVQNSDCQFNSCVKPTGAGDAHDYRLFSGRSSGSGTFYGKVTGESSQYVVFCRNTSGPECAPSGLDERFYLEFSASFQTVTLRATGSASQGLGSLVNGNWGLVDLQFGGNGGVCSTTQVRARLNGGSWSSCVEMANSGALAAVELFYNAFSGRELWVDELSVNP